MTEGLNFGELHKLIADALDALSHAVGRGDHSPPVDTAVAALRGGATTDAPPEPEAPPET